VTGRLGIVIVSYRSGAALPGLLTDLGRHEPESTVVVVDNASPEGPPAVQARVELVSAPANLGFGRASNLGASRHADNVEVLAFLNPDVRLRGSSLSELADELEQRPDVDVATGPLIDEHGVRVASAWGPTSLLRGFWAATGWELRRLRRLASRFSSRGANLSATSMRTSELEVEGHVLGGAMIVRRQRFASVGGFDERFFLYWEDADLCARIRKEGGRIMVLPATPMVHIEGTSSAGTTSRQRWEWYLEGARLFADEHLTPWRARLLLAAMRFGRLLRRAGWSSPWSRR
jgi:N-acetylglucosaminyl-diphospho-decaprenol L-rhamnosyltransferase